MNYIPDTAETTMRMGTTENTNNEIQSTIEQEKKDEPKQNCHPYV